MGWVINTYTFIISRDLGKARENDQNCLKLPRIRVYSQSFPSNVMRAKPFDWRRSHPFVEVRLTLGFRL